MSVNSDIADRLEQMAALLELTGANKFRVNAHSRAARVIGDLQQDLAAIANDRKALTAIDGVGEGTADKIIEFVETGKIEEHEELLSKVPNGLLDVLEVPGLGPKTVKNLWEQLEVESIDDLKRVIEDESILTIPRMGKKTVENIKQSIAFREESGERTPLGVALPIAEAVLEIVRNVKGVKQAEYAGSLRRGKDTIGDIDILATTSDAPGLRDAFTTMDTVEQVLAKGESKCSVRMKVKDVTGKTRAVQADLRIVPGASFGAAMHYFSGSKEHNIRVRERAQKQGLTLNEYGLYPEDDEDTPPQQRGVKAKAGKTEESIFKALGMPFIPPEIREDRGEINLTETPDLIEVDDVKAELHAHTTASDGALSIEQLASEAKERGFHTIAVTDHSKSQAVANGLDADRLRAHIKDIHKADKAMAGIRILAGSEVDILTDGRLDYDDDLLAELDIVVASPHWSLQQKPVVATKRLLAAIEHPHVHIIGHPCGRLINRREGLSPDINEIASAAAAAGVALEINAHWMRLDLRDVHVKAALDAGALIAINCDVHSAEDFDNLRYGVTTGRRGWLTPERCVNCWPAKQLHAWLKDRSTHATA